MANFLKSLFGAKDQQKQAVEAEQSAEPTVQPLHITDDTFKEVVLQASMPALVDFWAPWCAPCRMVAPIVEDLAVKYEGRVVVAKINTDESAQVAGSLGIMGIPTLILFKDGQEVDRVIGYAPQKVIESKLQAVLD